MFGFNRRGHELTNGFKYNFKLAIVILYDKENFMKSIQTPRKYEVSVMRRKYPVLLQADDGEGGYRVECPEFRGCTCQGDTIEEALSRIKEDIKRCLKVVAVSCK